MLTPIDGHLATTEHCELLKQCNDAGCDEILLKKTRTVQNCQYLFLFNLLLVWRLLQYCQAVGEVTREGALERQSQQQSMGGSWAQTCKHCLTFTLTLTSSFTLAQLPLCRFGRMNRRVAFTVCITLSCPYRLMSLHRTISTSIRAVDDNQVCSF